MDKTSAQRICEAVERLCARDPRGTPLGSEADAVPEEVRRMEIYAVLYKHGAPSTLGPADYITEIALHAVEDEISGQERPKYTKL